jgi:predicted DNA binding protein
MSLVVEFVLPADAVALESTLTVLPDVSVTVEENVWDAAGDLTPYVWVTGASAGRFGSVASDDPSVDAVDRIETVENACLYRLHFPFTEPGFLRAVCAVDAAIQSASATDDYWTFVVRFDDREALSAFQRRCCESEVSYDVSWMSDLSTPSENQRSGLTPKQHEALETAYEMGYFSHPRDVTLADIANRLDISRQALSRRFRPGQRQLFANTFGDEPPAPHEE